MRFRERLEAAFAAGRRAAHADPSDPHDAAFSDARATSPAARVRRRAHVALDTEPSRLAAHRTSEADVLICAPAALLLPIVPGLVREHLPCPDAFPPRFSADEVETYLARRLSVIAIKWNLERLTAIDSVSARVLNRWVALEPQPGREIIEAVASAPPARQS